MANWQWILWWLGLIACLTLMGWALFWDRHRGRLRCPKCWYDMSAAVGRRCPECGHTAPSDKHFQRTRRRWKTCLLALVAGSAISVLAVAANWRAALRVSTPHLPSTALILLCGRIDEPALAVELTNRLTEGTWTVWRGNRDALSDWQWRVLRDRLADLSDPMWSEVQHLARTFSQPRPPSPIIVTPQELLCLGYDATGTAAKTLNDRIQFPDPFRSSEASNLVVNSSEISTTDGYEVRLYLVSSSAHMVLYAITWTGDTWNLAGAYNISAARTPVFKRLDQDQSIFEIRTSGGLSGRIDEWWDADWCGVDDRGLHCIHNWLAGRVVGSHTYVYSCSDPVIQTDERGRFVQQSATLDVKAWFGIDPARCSAQEQAEFEAMDSVFQRTGRIRYRWNASRKRFVFSASESDWTEDQVSTGEFRGNDELFITQNFDTLINLATGDDPAKRAWVRLALTRLSDGAAKTRLEGAIEKHKKK